LPHLDSAFAISALTILGGLLAVVALLLFGEGVGETIFAVFRITFGTLFHAIGAACRLVFGSMLAFGWYFFGALSVIAVVGGWVVYVYFIKPGEITLTRFRPPACTELLDRKGNVLDYVCPFDGLRVWRPIEAIGTNLQTLVVMLEDDKFYEHGGLDMDEIWNSLEKNLETNKLSRGGSTITQQLAKNLFLSKEKTFIRKASEVPLALRLEHELTKDQILELYLNTIEWGPGIFGAEAASRLYFDHEAAGLKEEEAWLLALMIPNPKELNLWLAPAAKKSILKRAQRLSKRLYLEHRMSKDEAKGALIKFTTFLETWMKSRPEALYTAGRHYPAKWALNRGFSLAEVVSIRRGAAGLLKRYKQTPLRSHLDRELQEKLEFKLQSTIPHSHDLSEVVAIMDGSEIRAMVPVSQASLVADVTSMATGEGLKAQVFPARSIPREALWPSN
jgi:monofunctional biosynthetic peptidoglycan transglycosylase